MANILFIDDEVKMGGYTKDELSQAGHNVTWLQASYKEDVVKEFLQIIAEQPGATWNFLILDITFPTDEFAGVWIFNELVKLGHRHRWDSNEIVLTKHMTGYDVEDLKDANSGDFLFYLKVFLNTADIPYERAMSNQKKDRGDIVAIIEAL